MNISLHPSSPADLDFCFAVTEAVMRVHVEKTWGAWDAATERSKYIERFSPESYRLILISGNRAGIVETTEHSDHLHLGTLYLLPQFQGRGIGAVVLQMIVAESKGKPIRLRTLAVNTRAVDFYAGHGFVVTQSTPERIYMERIAK